MNLPNKITLTRICLIPVVIALYLINFPYHYLISAIMFALTATTDFLDGYFARKLNQVTNLGKFLDPIADKVLVVTGLLLILERGVLPFAFGSIACIVIISRELIVGALRQIAAAENKVLAADWWGKVKTCFQDVAIPLLMISVIGSETYVEWIYWLGIAGFAASLLLTIFSGINYVVKNREILKTVKAKN